MSNIKISGFYDEYSPDLKKQLEFIKANNEHYMCPRVVNGKNISNYTYEEFVSQIKPMLDEYNVKFSSIGSPIGKVGLYDEEGYQAQITKLKELVKIAQVMDCKYIRMFSFRVKPGNYDEYFPVVVKKLKGFLECVKGTNVVLLHENEKRIYGDVPERCLQLYKEINDPQFQLCYDASNLVQCGVNPRKAYDMMKDYVVYYHVKDCSPEKVEVPLGMGIGGYDAIVKDLIENRNYDGFMTLEPHTGKYAKLKNVFNVFCCLTCLVKPISKFHKVFRRIDKQKGIKLFQKVTTKDIMTWQYEALKDMITKVEKGVK